MLIFLGHGSYISNNGSCNDHSVKQNEQRKQHIPRDPSYYKHHVKPIHQKGIQVNPEAIPNGL